MQSVYILVQLLYMHKFTQKMLSEFTTFGPELLSPPPLKLSWNDSFKKKTPHIRTQISENRRLYTRQQNWACKNMAFRITLITDPATGT